MPLIGKDLALVLPRLDLAQITTESVSRFTSRRARDLRVHYSILFIIQLLQNILLSVEH
jgi:hypothetical protein